MNWGKWIMVAFVFFAIFIGTLSFVCFRQDVSLVSATYYDEDLNYQERYDQLSNAENLAVKPLITVENNEMNLRYKNFGKIQEGTITIMRPADSSLDHSFTIHAQYDSIQRYSLPDAQRGLYKIRMQWSEGDKKYQLDKTIVI